MPPSIYSPGELHLGTVLHVDSPGTSGGIQEDGGGRGRGMGDMFVTWQKMPPSQPRRARHESSVTVMIRFVASFERRQILGCAPPPPASCATGFD